ncbi:MAG TPA: hypothetical protein VLN56_07350 [Gammaproteobacteria bacterium]|nr:hypothetical protein [Gammaproteobacteria bacterium]
MNQKSLIVLFALLILVSACAQQLDNTRTRVNVKTLAKTDIDSVLDIHVREARNYCRRLMIKLYKRNPRELRKSAVPDINRNLRRIFNETHNWQFEELDNRKGVDAIYLTFDESFEGDRVFAFIAGLTSMIMASYDYQSDFYMFDTVDPQKLYNSARNIEIAVWKLGHDLDVNGEPFLYSNSLPGETTNLSYERLFGKLIATQDTIALIMAGRTNRVIRKVIQRMATAAFLPI